MSEDIVIHNINPDNPLSKDSLGVVQSLCDGFIDPTRCDLFNLHMNAMIEFGFGAIIIYLEKDSMMMSYARWDDIINKMPELSSRLSFPWIRRIDFLVILPEYEHFVYIQSIISDAMIFIYLTIGYDSDRFNTLEYNDGFRSLV